MKLAEVFHRLSHWLAENNVAKQPPTLIIEIGTDEEFFRFCVALLDDLNIPVSFRAPRVESIDGHAAVKLILIGFPIVIRSKQKGVVYGRKVLPDRF